MGGEYDQPFLLKRVHASILVALLALKLLDETNPDNSTDPAVRQHLREEAVTKLTEAQTNVHALLDDYEED